MKNEATCAKKFSALLKKLKSNFKPAPYPAREPVTQVVVSFLEWNATRAAAEAAHEKLMEYLVDTNDLRVSHAHEVIECIGVDYPMAEERATRMHEVLQEIFLREHMVTLSHLQGKSRKQILEYLESIPAITPYVASAVALTAFGVNVVPVDDLTAAALKAEGAADDAATPDEIAIYLEKQIKAGEAAEVFILLRDWSDSMNKLTTPKKKAPAAEPAGKAEASKPVKKSAGKK